MKMLTRSINLPGGAWALLIGGLALGMTVVACKRAGSTDSARGAAGDVPPAAPAPPVDQAGKGLDYLRPLTSAPWLGHADDGSLVTLEFFADATNTACRSKVKSSMGNPPTLKSAFKANRDLTEISWDDGKSSATYLPDAERLEAVVVSAAGVHHASLQQVTGDVPAALASFRQSVPDDGRARDAHDQFNADLKTGGDWWRSGAGWELLATPEGLVADPQPVALIRPASAEPLKLPAFKSGGDFNVPLLCLLPPGSALEGDAATVGVVAELHCPDSVQASWILNLLNPGSITQELNALWIHQDGEPLPAGPATLYVYLARTRPEGDAKITEIAKPISNLLELKIEFPAPQGSATAPPDGQ